VKLYCITELMERSNVFWSCTPKLISLEFFDPLELWLQLLKGLGLIKKHQFLFWGLAYGGSRTHYFYIKNNIFLSSSRGVKPMRSNCTISSSWKIYLHQASLIWECFRYQVFLKTKLNNFTELYTIKSQWQRQIILDLWGVRSNLAVVKTPEEKLVISDTWTLYNFYFITAEMLPI